MPVIANRQRVLPWPGFRGLPSGEVALSSKVTRIALRSNESPVERVHSVSEIEAASERQGGASGFPKPKARKQPVWFGLQGVLKAWILQEIRHFRVALEAHQRKAHGKGLFGQIDSPVPLAQQFQGLGSSGQGFSRFR